VVDELATELKDATAIFAVDYRGISVPQQSELREDWRGCRHPLPDRQEPLTLRAADEAGTDGIKDYLSGPTALALVKGDAALAARRSTASARVELLTYKGGLMDGEEPTPTRFTAIAKLPAGRPLTPSSRRGGEPDTGLVRGPARMIQGLALQLGQIAEQAWSAERRPPRGRGPAEGHRRKRGSPSRGSSGRGGSPSGEAPADEAPAAEEPAPDPRPAESPEESSEEEAPEGEDAGQGRGGRDHRRDQDLGEEPAETSENSDENKEDSE